MQRTKGARYENEVMAMLSSRWGIKARRLLGQARDGGADGFIPPFVFEFKRRKELKTLTGWLQQCVDALPRFEKECKITPPVPVVVMRADNGESMVLMRLSDFANVVIPDDFMEEG